MSAVHEPLMNVHEIKIVFVVKYCLIEEYMYQIFRVCFVNFRTSEPSRKLDSA